MGQGPFLYHVCPGYQASWVPACTVPPAQASHQPHSPPVIIIRLSSPSFLTVPYSLARLALTPLPVTKRRSGHKVSEIKLHQIDPKPARPCQCYCFAYDFVHRCQTLSAFHICHRTESCGYLDSHKILLCRPIRCLPLAISLLSLPSSLFLLRHHPLTSSHLSNLPSFPFSASSPIALNTPSATLVPSLPRCLSVCIGDGPHQTLTQPGIT